MSGNARASKKRPKLKRRVPRRKLPAAQLNEAGEYVTPPGFALARAPADGGGGHHPKLVIDWALVERLAVIHCTVDEIALALDVSKETLYEPQNAEKFKQAVQRGRAQGSESLRRAQFNVALGDPGFTGDPKRGLPPRPPSPPNPTMLIWLGKTILDQRERVVIPSDPSNPPPRDWDTLPESERPKVITIRVGAGEDIEEV